MNNRSGSLSKSDHRRILTLPVCLPSILQKDYAMKRPSILTRLFGPARNKRRRILSHQQSESLEARTLLTTTTLPVLMVIADQQDFYYQEYNDTRNSIVAAGVDVQVAATTAAPSTPHWNSGQDIGHDGVVVPDLTLASVNASEYSAIVFVGGWGSSMYQYAFPGTYQNALYNGDLATRQVVNDLINEFDSSEKYLGFICHATAIGAWSRVNGTSILAGRQVSVPYVGSPAVIYNGVWYGNTQLGQYEQAVTNGAIPNTASGQYGDPTTATDDVVVDGRIITAENWDSAAMFGTTIAQVVQAAADQPVNQAPVANDGLFQINENSTAGTVVGVISATDPDLGQSLSYTILAGNTNGAFALNSATGQLSVANSAAVDFETNPVFQLTVQVTDNAGDPLSDIAVVTIQLADIIEAPPASVYVLGNDLVVQGSDASDLIYIWSGQTAEQVFVWMNGVNYGSRQVSSSGRTIVYGGNGNDRIYATDARSPVNIFGEAGHDQITGGSADDVLDGGADVDRIWGSAGDDLMRGGAGNDFLFGREGNDIILGGAGDDYIDGDLGRDIAIGGTGADYIRGGADQDLLIGGLTDLDENDTALRALAAYWNSNASFAQRTSAILASNQQTSAPLSLSSIHDDNVPDVICGGDGMDLFFVGFNDDPYGDKDDLFAW